MKEKILIADDSIFMRKAFKEILVKEGYTELLEACDGDEAIDIYAVERPDLVIMNVTMYEVDGIQALKEIKSMDANAKVIMSSATGQEAVISSAKNSGATDFIITPFKPEALLEAVSKVMEQPLENE